MIINYLEIRERYDRKINMASEKKQKVLTRRIVKLGQWIEQSIRSNK